MRGTTPRHQVFLPLIGAALFLFATVNSFARQQPSQDPAPSAQGENASNSKAAVPTPAAAQHPGSYWRPSFAVDDRTHVPS